ncbi:MAG: polysaccharide biosynthesis tyrosine autokinase [Cyclobacteriaceae bacterium]|nr:polysaccharide biosynthesis tyrosine autokinase [Cyclobacteriaceae bacterium]
MSEESRNNPYGGNLAGMMGGGGRDPGTFDSTKMFDVLRKTWYWIILLAAITTTLAYLKARWTRPIYQSDSILQLDVKKDASVLGFRSFDENINNISREIEFLRSNLFFTEVAKAIDMKVSYYEYGKVLIDERYKGSPFELCYHNLEGTELMDKRIDLEVIDERSATIRFDAGGKEHEHKISFGDTLQTAYGQLLLKTSSNFDPSYSNKKFFFQIHSLSAVVRLLAANTTVQPLDFNARTITISFKDYNPMKARDILTAIDTLYIYYTQLEKNKANSQKIEFLNEQLTQTEEKLGDLETYFENFTIGNRTTDLNQNLSKTIVWLEKLDSQRFEIQRKIQVFNEVYDDMHSDRPLRLNPLQLAIFPNETAADLRRLSELAEEKAKLLSSFKENTLVYIQKVKEIDFLKERMFEFLDVYRDELYRQRDRLAMERRRLDNEFAGLPSKRTEYSKTLRYYSLYEDFYLSLMKSKAEFELAQAGTVTDFKILSMPSSPGSPILPNKPLYYAIGLFGGLFLGMLLLVIRYLLHNKITDQKQLEHYTDIPVLGVIPYYSKVKETGNRLVVDKNPKSALTESFRNLRTNMDFLEAYQNNPIISVTSTISGEGKTFVAVNMGGVISMLGSRVVLIDLDMRKPRLQKVFYNAEQNFGVSTILIGKHSVEDCLLPTTLENLYYISSGPIPPNPAELINGPRFAELLAELRKRFDTVIIDTPPVGLVTDGIIAMKKAGLKIFVTRSDYSKVAFIEEIHRMQRVHKFENLNLVLNSVGQGVKKVYKGYGYYEEEQNEGSPLGWFKKRRRRKKNV